MILDVDTAGAVPAYEQVRSQLADMILSGALPVGDRLPTIRQLAADLDLAPGTVARVYRELESAGLVLSRVRHGTVVAEGLPRSADVVHDHLAESSRSYALAARRLGISLEEAIAAIASTWADLPDA